MEIRKNIFSDKLIDCLGVATILVSLFLIVTFSVSADAAEGQRLAPGPVTVTLKSAPSQHSIADALVWLGDRFVGSSVDGSVTFDGVPSGTYALRVQHLDYDEHLQKIVLSDGKRKPITIQLQPSERKMLAGQVILENGMVVSGARIVVKPLSVPASIVGSYEFSTDWQGNYKLLEIPAGTYVVELSAFGCAPKIIELHTSAWPEVFILSALTEPGIMRVLVRDAESGQPLSGARVVISDSWPLGILGDRITDAQGVVQFLDLQVGQLNWMNTTKQLSITRPWITVRVEADGYAPQLQIANLLVNRDNGSTFEVQLISTEPVQEQESNDSIVQAQNVWPGRPIVLTIDRNGDVDTFKFLLEHPTRLQITAHSPPINTYLTLFDVNGKRVATRGADLGKDNSIDQGFPAGVYFLEVREWGDNASSQQPFLVNVVATTSPDPFEPNDRSDQARLIQPGNELRGSILPRGDLDLYHFQLDRPGTVRFSVDAYALDTYLRVFSDTGRVLKSLGISKNRSGVLETGLDAGRYIFEIREWGDNAETVEPYSIRFHLVSDDDHQDPDRDTRWLAAVREQALRGISGATINRLGDYDRYRVVTDQSGLLRVHLLSPIAIYMRIRDQTGKVLAQRGQGGWKSLDLIWSAPAPMTAFIEIEEWGNNQWSASPYLLQTWWEPADEYERTGRNDDSKNVTVAAANETIRGSITPLADVDNYHFPLDHSGYFEINGSAPTDLYIGIYASSLDSLPLVQRGFAANTPIKVGADVSAGDVYLRVEEWGNNHSRVGAYTLNTRLDRAEPNEPGEQIANETLRQLRLGEAQSFAIDQFSDRDRFLFSADQAGEYVFHSLAPVATYLTIFDDRSGKLVGQYGVAANRIRQYKIVTGGPTRYRIEITEWGNNNRSTKPGHLLVRRDDVQSNFVVENIVWSNESTDPTLIHFSRTPEKQAAKANRVRLDVDGDGKWDIDIPSSGSVAYRLREEGIYAATALLEGTASSTRSRFWINAVGPRERKGILINVYQPVAGQTIATDIPVKVRAISYSGARIERVTLAVDGKHIDTAYKLPFDLQVPWASLRGGSHEIEVSVFDRAGNHATLKREIERAPYFNLQPKDGAVVTGETVIVRWTGLEFGPAQVRYRRQGTEAWQVVIGEHARQRVVALQELESGVAYEFQPLGDGEWGPIHRFSRVKGLAFGRSRYGANIARDYDQRLAISVRNHAEHPMSVRLRSVAPQESRLLVGFVGEGSVDVPFTLKAGEEREFMLGISAQDVIKPIHTFPVRIESGEGLSDEALVEVKVKLPEVVFKWEALGPSHDGMSQRFRLRNGGDALTDLQILSDRNDTVITPAVDHATFPRGATLEVTVAPRLYEGFQQLQGKLIAKALDKTVSQDFEIALNEEESLYQVSLSPGDSIGDADTRMLQDAYRMVGANLDAAAVDWSSRQYPEDTDGDGKVDRWFMASPQTNILWVGDDTEGDGQVDFVHADVGKDGKFDYSAYKVQDQWQQTNIIEAWLELNFKLPWARSHYEKHDVEIFFNDQVVGTLSDQIPEGNYRFRLPPSVINLGDKENHVAIRSKHLRGGHYVVSSDFRIMLRLTGAQLWGVGTSREDAARRLRQTQEIMVDAPDYSISSRELFIKGELQPGNEVTVTVPLRNLGARRTWYVPVALVRSQPGKKDITVAEQLVEGVSLIDSAPLSIPWKIEAGSYQLKVVVDPDNLTSDQRRENNVAMLSLDIAGDNTLPTMEIQQPLEGRNYDTSLVTLEATAKDDVGISALELQIDGGLWVLLTAADQTGLYRAKVLLQPGAHRLTFRATDLSGNRILQSVNVRSNALQPRIDILHPQAGNDIDARQIIVVADVDADVIFAAGRINNGFWTRLAVEEGKVQGAVSLVYGSNKMELMVANAHGTVNYSTVTVTATRQPTPDEALVESDSEDGRIEIEGLGVIDLFGPLNRVIRGAKQNSSDASAPGLTPWRKIAQLFELLQPINTALASDGAPGNKQRFQILPSCNGATVVLQKSKTDWYCTNRPKVNVGFRLPQWVMALNIPDPDKNPEQYEKMIRALMERLARSGVDTGPFERYFDVLLRRVSNLDHVTQLPQGVSGFFQWLGISANLLAPPAQDPEAQARWRKQLVSKTKIFWARLLSTEDTNLIAEGLKRRMQATQKFDEAVALEAQAVIDSIGAYQQLTQDVLEIVPLVGESIDLYAAFTGTAPLTGQQLSAFERSVRAIAFLGPIAFDSAMARYAGADDVTDALLGKSDDMARSMQDFASRLKDPDFRKAVAKATKGRIPEEELLKASENILASKRLRELIEAAGNSPRGRAWETFIAKRGGGVDLNDLNRNFPIIDWINPKGEYVSIYNSILKGDKLANNMVGKYMDLFGFGANPKKMHALLKKHGHAISEIDFFKKARFHVPTKEHADLFRRTLLDRFNTFGLDDLLDDTADLLRKAWPAANDKQLLQKMMDMVMYTDNLPKVVQPVGALRRAILHSPVVIGRQLSRCDAD